MELRKISNTDHKNDVTQYENIIKSVNDKRLYRGIKLENGFKALLISDSLTDKSAASLTVNIGSLHDPKELQGLAHFLEHMLFMGSKKYSQENEYQKFVTEHGGSTNAYTAFNHTNFYFDIDPEYLADSLDRFAQFFLDPLFTESATDREVNAVNSEHEKNLVSDPWRIKQVEKSTCSPNHDYSNFGTGSIETLDRIPKSKGIAVREKLLEFHNKFYSSNLMCLAILGKESLEDLEQMVIDLFKNVKNKNVEQNVYKENPVGEKELKKKILVVPIKDIRQLKIEFPIPDPTEHYRSAPDYYISHLIGHEGPGSLLSLLRDRGWCNNLTAGTSREAAGLSFFVISVDLNLDAVQHVDDILTLLFQYVQLLKTEGIQEWIFVEDKKIEEMTFRFKDKESPMSYVTTLASSMHDYPIEDLLYVQYHACEIWRPDLIEEILGYIQPENMRLVVVEKVFTDTANLEEKWYGTKYALEDIPEETIQKWKNVSLSEELQLPPPNEFVPENFDLLPLDANVTEFPYIINETSISRMWFKQDDEYLLPKNTVSIDFFSPVAYFNPKNCGMICLFVNLLKDSLNEYGYAAKLAGLGWTVTNTKHGMMLVTSGYSEKLPVLLSKVMNRMTNFKVNLDRFKIIKETIVRLLKNFDKEQPHQHASFYLSWLLADCCWSKLEQLEALEAIQLEDLQKFIPELLSQLFIQGLIHGNCNTKNAFDIINIIEKPFLSCPGLLPQQLTFNREVCLECGSNFVYDVSHEYHHSSCVDAFYQCFQESTINNVTIEMFTQMVSEPCFNVLRTQEQLGYIVSCGVRRTNGVQGFIVIVQSDRHPLFIDSRIETFLKSLGDLLENMAEEEFELNKQALITKKLEKPKQMKKLSSRFFSEIITKCYNFDRANIEVAQLSNLTKKDIVNFYNELISPDSEKRRKVAVRIRSEVTNPSIPDDCEVKSNEIKDVITFKTSHSLYPLQKPYMEIPPLGTKSKL